MNILQRSRKPLRKNQHVHPSSGTASQSHEICHPKDIEEKNLNCTRTRSHRYDLSLKKPARSAKLSANGSSRNLKDEERLISKSATISWPPQSPDLTPPDFLLWGHIKQVVYKDNPSTLTEPQDAIRIAIGGVSLETYRGVVEEARRRLILCAAQNGGHVGSG